MENKTGFYSWMRSLNITRRKDDRWVAGVASGLAARLNIDPLIVRGVFVVLIILGGPGILLYVAGWLLLPDTQGKIHLQEIFRGRGDVWAVVVTVLIGLWLVMGIFGTTLVPAFTIWSWDVWGRFGLQPWVGGVATTIFWLGIVGVAVYFVHRAIVNKGSHGGGSPQAESAQQANAASFADRHSADPHVVDPHIADQPRGESAQPGWAQQATTVLNDGAEKVGEWSREFSENVTTKTEEWSKKYAAEHARFKLGAGYVLITIALALLAGGASAALAYAYNTGHIWFVGLLGFAVVFAVSMIVAGLRGKKSGTVGFLGFLSVAALAVMNFVPLGSNFYLVGNERVTDDTTSVAMFAGDLTVDLREFEDDPSVGRYDVNMGFGDLYIVLPEKRPTTISIAAGAGGLREDYDGTRRERSGLFTERKIVVNEDATGEPLYVSVKLVAGEISVRKEALR